MWGDVGRCGEMRGDMGRDGEVWGEMGRHGEIRGDLGRDRPRAPQVEVEDGGKVGEETAPLLKLHRQALRRATPARLIST